MSNTIENKTENGGKLIFSDGQELMISGEATEITKDIYTGTNDVKEIILPESVKEIKARSFSWYKNMCAVTLPKEL